MLDRYIVISIVVCSTSLVAYIFRLMFASKCSNLDIGCLHLKRNTKEERSDISFRLPMSLPTTQHSPQSFVKETIVEV